MKTLLLNLFVSILCLATTIASAQTTDSAQYKYGIRQTYGELLTRTGYPEIRGRIRNYKWTDIEPSNNVWNWQAFDSDLISNEDGLPILLMIFTKEASPDWLYTSAGVPKVIEYNSTNDSVGFSPYYADPTYKLYFERMINTVANHIKTLPESVKKWLSIQGCLGEEGDYIGYRNADGSNTSGSDTGAIHVDPIYKLNRDQLSVLFKEYTQYYYNQYAGTNIGFMTNPSSASAKTISNINWVIDSLPGSFIKYPILGKGYQENDELDKSFWLIPVLNSKHNGLQMRARSDLGIFDMNTGLWNAHPPRNMFALLSSMTYWGMDWSDQMPTSLKDPVYKTAYDFFNKYAGQKDTATAAHAMCVLRDGLDASDAIRFPALAYGTVSRTNAQRYINIQNQYASKGALLTDVYHAMALENASSNASGTNDVGWRILPGNYEKYLHQITPNETSAGYWNVNAPNDTSSVYGRFARGFDLANGKNALYFDADNGFLHNAALNSQYPVMISVTYLDKGFGSWQLFYDAQDSSNKASVAVTCSNSGQWKKISVTLRNAYFGNRSTSGSDFYIRSTGSEDVIFSLIESERPDASLSNDGLFASAIPAFDTLCINSISIPKSFLLTGAFLNGSDVTVGPFPGYKFSIYEDSAYSDTLIISNYDASFSKTIYTEFAPVTAGAYNGNIPVSGGGVLTGYATVNGIAVNSSPVLSANINPISCMNSKNGAIDLVTNGGTSPFTYSWVNTGIFKDSAQDISGLSPSTYTVTVSSYAGCKTSAAYVITQPVVLSLSLSADSMICRGGTTVVHVTATGGTAPYNGTGDFTVSSGKQTYTVIDAHGCSDTASIMVNNGAGMPPGKPGTIAGLLADATGLCGGGNFTYTIDPVANATSYTWNPSAGSTINSKSIDGTQIILGVPANFTTGTLSVTADNICGTSTAQAKALITIAAKPGAISGPVSVLPLQTGLIYAVPPVNGLTYTWAVPPGAKITAGQNTPSVTVNWGTTSGNVNVKAVNACGTSSNSVLIVTLASNTFTSSVSSLPAYDTLCINGLSTSKSFTLSGSGLSGSNVVVGSLAGYKISAANIGPYSDSLIISGYGTSFSQPVYVKFSPTAAGSYNGNIVISGGGGNIINVAVSGTAVNSSPLLSANLTNVSCYGAKNGAIDLSTSGGVYPFSYDWKGAGTYDPSAQDISGLAPSTYTVTVSSYAGCKTSASYIITQPGVLTVSFAVDSMLCKNSTTIVHVSAAGGTAPYNGTGDFPVSSGKRTFKVTDAHGCSSTQSVIVSNGTGIAPVKPGTIAGLLADATGVCGDGDFTYTINPVANATSYTWKIPANSTVKSKSPDGTQIILNVQANFTAGTLSVTANNSCGSSAAQAKDLIAIAAKPGAISGPTSVLPLQTGLVYSVPPVTGITYTWAMPSGTKIISGQNTSSVTVKWGTVPGNVNVKAVNACGISSNSVLSVTVASQAPMQQNKQSVSSKDEGILVFPNPANNVAYISFTSGEIYKYTLTLTDITGKLLVHNDGIAVKGKNTVPIDLHNYASGTYIVTFINYQGEMKKIRLLKE